MLDGEILTKNTRMYVYIMWMHTKKRLYFYIIIAISIVPMKV